jgi:hypothetical protein
MSNFKRNKIKLSLIDDYIQIYLINNFCLSVENIHLTDEQFFLLKENKTICSKLNENYLCIFEKLKLQDLSLSVLLKDLKNNNTMLKKEQDNNFSTLNYTLSETKKVLDSISTSLDTKLKLLKL